MTTNSGAQMAELTNLFLGHFAERRDSVSDLLGAMIGGASGPALTRCAAELVTAARRAAASETDLDMRRILARVADIATLISQV